ncbi:MAG: DJ-1/PfpI family protein [Candidatus Micrarchaeaceae archaeon]
MRFLIVIAPKDFKDESIALMKLLFDKWGVGYSITSYTSNECIGMHGATYRPNFHASKATSIDYDGIILIDGPGVDAYKMYDYRPLLDLTFNFNNNNKYVIGISNAVKIPARANIVRDRLVATNDRETVRLVNLFHGVPSEKEYEISGNLITVKSSNNMEDSVITILEHIGVT